MPPSAHVSIIGHVLHVGMVDVNLVVSILTRAHGDFLLACSTVTRNIVTQSSASGASAAVLLSRVFAVTGFHSVSAKSFSLVLLWDFA